MMTVFLVLLAFFALASAAFCAGSETGFLSVSRARILHLAREGGRRARIVQAALADMSRTTTTLLIGNNLASVTFSSVSAALAIRFCSGSLSRTLWSFAAAWMTLYFAEFMPKLLASARPLRRMLLLAPVYRAVSVALAPLTAVALALTGIFIPRRETKIRPTSADLIRILEDRKDGVCLSDIESALIGRIVALRVKNRPVSVAELLDALDEGDARREAVQSM